MNETLSAYSQVPSKLILSGEHSVLYGTSALSLAINLPTHCHLNFQSSTESSYSIDLPDLDYHAYLSDSEWQQELQSIEQQISTANKLLLSQPHQLILLCFAKLQKRQRLPVGKWTLQIKSENWLGRGMGSSAAVILAVLKAIIECCKLQISNSELLSLATEIECYQHGKSSGLDPATMLAEAVIEYRVPNHIQPLELPDFPLPAWLIDTGKPQSATSDCVLQVHDNFAQDNDLWKVFANTVQDIKQAWQNQQNANFLAAIRYNQKLLEKIGIVPNRVAQFIEQLQDTDNTAAKVCGAGSVSGDSGGVVIYFSKNAPKILCQEYGYKWQALDLYPKAER